MEIVRSINVRSTLLLMPPHLSPISVVCLLLYNLLSLPTNIKVLWITRNQPTSSLHFVKQYLEGKNTKISELTTGNTPGPEVITFTSASVITGYDYHRNTDICSPLICKGFNVIIVEGSGKDEEVFGQVADKLLPENLNALVIAVWRSPLNVQHICSKLKLIVRVEHS